MNKIIQPLDDAYKLITGDPSMTAVSDASKGEIPLSDKEQRMKEFHQSTRCSGIDEAYAMLFESLSMILREK